MADTQTKVPQTSSTVSRIGHLLRHHRTAKLTEFGVVFIPPVVLLLLLLPLAGENLFLQQSIVLGVNIWMLAFIYVGIRLRGDRLAAIGLSFGRPTRKSILKAVLQSMWVFLLALAAFVLAAVIMANILGIPEQADMSAYQYLQGNLPRLLLVLCMVYLISSLGEEVIYRGFLITRLEELMERVPAAQYVAILLSALIFGLVHFGWGPAGMVQTTFMGLALGFAFVKVKRNLWVNVLAHAYMDTILMVQMYLA